MGSRQRNDERFDSYGHTKHLFNYRGLLTVHNLILVQMHKVYRAVAPVQTRELFSTHFPPVIPDKCILPHKIKLASGLNQKNIIEAENSPATGKLYYTVPNARLSLLNTRIAEVGVAFQHCTFFFQFFKKTFLEKKFEFFFHLFHSYFF